MFRGKRIAVVIPAYNEADKIARTVRSVPGFVDAVIVVDDASSDGTGRIAARSQRRGLVVLRHAANRGVGAAIATGYCHALELGIDATGVMAGDAQMDPADLPALLQPVVTGEVDYAKGNRFAWPGVWRRMPLTRLLGNVLLSLMTRVSSGYWHIFDSQCGYTVASRAALEAVEPRKLFARYGYPNDLLGRLKMAGARVADVPVRPVYGPGWRSGIRIWTVVYPIAFLLLRTLATRLARRTLGTPRELEQQAS